MTAGLAGVEAQSAVRNVHRTLYRVQSCGGVGSAIFFFMRSSSLRVYVPLPPPTKFVASRRRARSVLAALLRAAPGAPAGGVRYAAGLSVTASCPCRLWAASGRSSGARKSSRARSMEALRGLGGERRDAENNRV